MLKHYLRYKFYSDCPLPLEYSIPPDAHVSSVHCKYYSDVYLLLETLISPETFAEVLCDDLDLPPTSFVSAIAQAIRQQSKQFDVEPEILLNEQKDQRIIIKV